MVRMEPSASPSLEYGGDYLRYLIIAYTIGFSLSTLSPPWANILLFCSALPFTRDIVHWS